MYRKGFMQAFLKLKKDRGSMDYSDLGWRDSDAYVLIDAFHYMRAHDCVPLGAFFDVGIYGVAGATAYAVSQGVANDFSPAAYHALHEAAREVGIKLHDTYEEQVCLMTCSLHAPFLALCTRPKWLNFLFMFCFTFRIRTASCGSQTPNASS